MAEAEKSRSYIEFHNKWTQELMDHCPPDILSELGIRAYTGSRDVPKDDQKAAILLGLAKQRAEEMGDEKQIDMTQYYMAVVGRDITLKRMQKQGSYSREDVEALHSFDNIIEHKAQKGIGEALFTYGKELYQHIRNGGAEADPADAQQALQFLESAVRKGVSSGYFFLGILALEGIWVHKDVETGLRLLYKGASKNNAYCYFYLSMLHHEGIVVEKSPLLEFTYLKRAAEEGFVQMQHNLGIAYFEGRLTRKNDRLALAWLREAARNGYAPSYQLAGDILFQGTRPGSLPPERSVAPNRLFALTQYLSAYQAGGLFLEPQIRLCYKALIEKDGFDEESLPKIKFVQVREEDKAIIEEQYQRDLEQRKQRQRQEIENAKLKFKTAA